MAGIKPLKLGESTYWCYLLRLNRAWIEAVVIIETGYSWYIQ